MTTDTPAEQAAEPPQGGHPETVSSQSLVIEPRAGTIVDFPPATPQRKGVGAKPSAPARATPSGPSRSGSGLPLSPRSRAFLKRYYPGVTRDAWNDWRWQNRNRLRSLQDIERIIELTPYEREAIVRHAGALPLGITPYYASLLDPHDASQPLRLSVVPRLDEYDRTPGEADDPLGEDGHAVVPGLVHRYPDRVLFLVTNFCSVYCRYCTRARLVGATGERALRKADVNAALDYIRNTPSIRDVLISGGDPLSLDEDRLDYILDNLRGIPHVEFIRIGSKQPVVQPQRITRSLVQLLRRHGPIWMSLHFTHPDEITPEVSAACARLADAGVPLGSQTVLLKGVNDDVQTMRRLVHGLLKIRVRPYYLYQCDPISGSAHFRTSVQKGLEIIDGLRGHTTGYAVPTFVIDAPGGGGKVPLLPQYVLGREGDDLLIRNFEHKVYRYPDPLEPSMAGMPLAGTGAAAQRSGAPAGEPA
ncbi:MAG: KamA family radical SAM protein [Gammaproteobacteria bacterium]|nr:KamA family radical SAM protein [Gammaproteobacteria bacterium]